MDFILVLFAVVLSALVGPFPSLQRDRWFWRLQGAVTAKAPGAGIWLSVALPPLLVGVALWLAGDWLFGLVGAAIGLMVLLYSFGREDALSMAKIYRLDLSREDTQGAYHAAARFSPDRRESDAASWPQLHEEALTWLSYRHFERYFPVLFWFAVLGLPGALFYRLVYLAVRAPVSGDRSQGQAVADEADTDAVKLLHWLEWLPLRILGLLLAIAGNFPTTIRAWRDLLRSAAASDKVLLALVRAACNGPRDPAPDRAADEVLEVNDLFHRTLILAVALVAIVELVF